MELNIRAGKRILYKQNGQWEVGELASGRSRLNDQGLYVPVWPYNILKQIHSTEHNEEMPNPLQVNINDVFLDAWPVENYWRDYKDVFMTKKEYLKFIESEEFMRSIEQAYVSDGEYYYYPISKYNKTWIEKQPFDYVVRMA